MDAAALGREYGHVDAAKLLVNEFRANANAKTNDGRTPLHLAAQNGHVNAAMLFVNEFRADECEVHRWGGRRCTWPQ